MSSLSLSKRHWILSDDEYQRLKTLCDKSIPTAVESSMVQQKFIEDRLQNKNQNEAAWASISDKIQPMLSSKIAAPPAPSGPTNTTGTNPALAVGNSSFTPASSQRQYLDRQ